MFILIVVVRLISYNYICGVKRLYRDWGDFSELPLSYKKHRGLASCWILHSSHLYKRLTMKKSKSTNTMLFCGTDKPVHVRQYKRVRFGRVEYVCEHCRSGWGSKAA